MEKGNKRGNFTGSIGFVLAAAGSAVGLGKYLEIPVSWQRRMEEEPSFWFTLFWH